MKKCGSYKNKASWPTMRPQACMIIICVAFWALHGWLIISQRFLLAGVEISEDMRDFLLFWRKPDGRTDEPTDGATERRTDRPSYARSHLKTTLARALAYQHLVSYLRWRRRIRTDRLSVQCAHSLLLIAGEEALSKGKMRAVQRWRKAQK